MTSKVGIKKAGKVIIENIRGIGGKHEFDLDADIVLLTGSNGMGKSSLLDALSLFLNGVDPGWPKEDNKPIILHADAKEGRVALSESRECTVTSNGSPVWKGISPRMDGAVRYLASAFRQDRPEVNLPVVSSFINQTVDSFRLLVEQAEETRQLLMKEQNDWERQHLAEKPDRFRAADAFSSSWTGEPLRLPKRGDGRPFFPNANMLSDQWESELRNMVTDLAVQEKRPDLAPAEEASPVVCLEQLLPILLEIEKQLIAAAPPEAPRRITDRLASMKSEARYTVRRELPVSGSLGEYDIPLGNSVIAATTRQKDNAEEDINKLTRLLRPVRTVVRKVEPFSDVLEKMREDSGSVVSMITSLPDELQRAFPVPVTHWWNESASTASRIHPPIHGQLKDWVNQAYSYLANAEEEIRKRAAERDRLDIVLDVATMLKQLHERSTYHPNNLKEGDEITREAILESLIGNEAAKSQASIEHIRRIREAAANWAGTERALLLWESANRKAQSAKLAGERVFTEALDVLETLAISPAKKKVGLLYRALEIPDRELISLKQAIWNMLEMFRITGQAYDEHGLVKKSWQKRKGQDGRIHRIDLDLKLPFETLSTGQKTIVAFCVMVALNHVLSNRLDHRILLVDDFTTSLDMQQLPRAAVILRQVAYQGIGGEGGRRQVILSSHHEDLTNRLLDYLLPPRGRSLKVINFKNWTRERGPECEAFVARESAKPGEKERFKTHFDRAREFYFPNSVHAR
jgi:energy-coupling factor transporter ATP-binding protein EcfA2